MTKDDRDLERYREEMGRDPPSSEGHPLSWQWDYRGKRKEREALAAQVESSRRREAMQKSQVDGGAKLGHTSR